MPITNNNIQGGLTFAVASDMRTGTVTYTGTTNYALYGILLTAVVETVTITGPDGIDLPPITVNPSVSRAGSVSMPIGSDLEVQQGEYTLNIAVVIGPPTDAGNYRSNPSSVEFCPGGFKPVITATANCKCGSLDITDATDYTGWELVSRALSITMPPIEGSWGTVTTAGAAISSPYGQLFNNVTYTSRLVITITDGTTTITGLSTSLETKVDCPSMCEIRCALQRVWAMFVEKAKVNTQQAETLKDIFNTAGDIAWLYQLGMDCGSADSSLVQSFWSVLAPTGINGDCCGCCDDAETVVRPACNQVAPDSGTSYTFVALPSPILAVTNIGNTITYTIQQEFVDRVLGGNNATIGSSDGSITVTSSLIDSVPPILAYNLAVPGIDKVWRFRVRVNFASGSITTSTFRDIRKYPATGFWSATNPTVTAGSVAGVSSLEIAGLFNIPGTVEQDLYPQVSIVSENPVVSSSALAKAFEILWVMAEPAFAIQHIDIVFYDTRVVPSATQGYLPAGLIAEVADVVTGLTSMELEVELRAV